MNYLQIFQSGGAPKVNERYWHNKRYTSDEIKKILAALNRQSLGKQIAVDGIIGPETIAAIRLFQLQHSDILKVDGLVGDQTASALGITGLGNSSLPQTRAGQNQARKPGIDTSTAQGRADKQASDYYNSPEMLKYLMNASNAAIGSPEYLNHYYNALNYVSPEIASKLRALNNEGDAYDEEASRNRGQAFNRQVGIKEFKNAMASGVLNSPEALDKWMTSHNLSKEEMNELMADPSVGDAMLTAGVQADNGRVMRNQKLHSVEDATRHAMDASGRIGLGMIMNPLRPIYTAATYKGNGSDGQDVLNHMAYNLVELSGLLKDKGMLTLHTSVPGKVYDFGRDLAIDIAGNPYATGDLLLGARNIGVAGKNVMANAKNGVYGTRPVSYTGIGERSVVNPVTNKRTIINETSTVRPQTTWADGTPIRTTDGRFANVGATGVEHKGLSANSNGLLVDDAMRNQIGQYIVGVNPRILGGTTQGSYQGGRTVARNWFEKTPYTDIDGRGIGASIPGAVISLNGQSSPVSPVIQQVPGYDKGITYGPYNGFNRTKFKKGGSINYQKISECGCKTKLKRVGGKLVNVDCNDNIIK